MSTNLLKAISVSVLSLSLWGCGSQQATETSTTKVTNGRNAATQEFPAVVLLVMVTPQGPGICTGTFVNSSQILTAAHCVEGLDPENPNLVYAGEVGGQLAPLAKALNFKRHPNYDIRLGVSAFDVAVVNFQENSAPATVALAASAPTRGDALTIVGYGNNENFFDAAGRQVGSGSGTKRIGSNRVADVAQGFISFIGVPGEIENIPEGDLVSSGSGDSGGPLFVNGKLAGVTSGGGLAVTSSGLLATSRYVDLNNSQVKPFLAEALKPTF